METTIKLKRNDTWPPLEAQLLDADDNPIPLDQATVKFLMADNKGNPKVSAQAEILDPVEARVRYNWQPADTDTGGGWLAEWEITFSDGKIATVPNNEYIKVIILPDKG